VTLPESLGRPALEPLWQAIHDRLSSGRPVDRVRVGPLEEEQREAMADLLGLDRLPGEHLTVALRRLDAVLAETCGRDARTVVAELVGPLDNHAARRERDRAERAALWDWLGAHGLIAAQPALAGWVDHVRRAGTVGGSVTATRAVLEDALRVLRQLPAQGQPLPVFAAKVLGDSHALDDGTRLSALVLRALAASYDTAAPQVAEQRRALWERAGVANDELSTVVLAAGMRPAGAGLLRDVLTACAAAGQAAALTLAQVRLPDPARFPAVEVHVVENPSVLALALARFGADCPPMVCTSGWPNTAAILLLRGLARDGARLRYHGDFDGEGIRIAAYVLAKTAAQPWRMSARDYLDAVATHPHGPDVGRVTPAPWDAGLAPAMTQQHIAIAEESVANLLLDELAPRGGERGHGPAM
jgi:uncharacterized protein (TIGR02679 family)